MKARDLTLSDKALQTYGIDRPRMYDHFVAQASVHGVRPTRNRRVADIGTMIELFLRHRSETIAVLKEREGRSPISPTGLALLVKHTPNAPEYNGGAIWVAREARTIPEYRLDPAEHVDPLVEDPSLRRQIEQEGRLRPAYL